MKKFYIMKDSETTGSSGKWILILFGILYLIMNYFVLDILIVKTGSLQSIYDVDIEVLGIFVGLMFSALISLYVFVVQRWRGFKETIQYIGVRTYIVTIVLATFCSVFVPVLAYSFFCKTLYYSIGSLILTFLLNALILTLCSPLLNLVVFLFVIGVGSVLAFVIYHIYYFVKSSSIKKSKVWKNIQTYLSKNDKKIRKIVLYPNKVEFYLRKKEADKTILFRGYAKLIPIHQDALLYFMKQGLSKEYQVTGREFKGKYCSVVLECEKGHRELEEKSVEKKKKAAPKKTVKSSGKKKNVG